MKATRAFAVLGALAFPFAVVVFGQGCDKKDKDEKKDDASTAAPAQTTAAPAPTPTPTPTAALTVEEDAGKDAADDGDAKKPSGPDPIAKCCNALQANMNSAPLDQKLYYSAMIAACNAARSSPDARAALAKVRAAAGAAKVPNGCY